MAGASKLKSAASIVTFGIAVDAGVLEVEPLSFALEPPLLPHAASRVAAATATTTGQGAARFHPMHLVSPHRVGYRQARHARGTFLLSPRSKPVNGADHGTHLTPPSEEPYRPASLRSSACASGIASGSRWKWGASSRQAMKPQSMRSM